jgi:hypothetical protein
MTTYLKEFVMFSSLIANVLSQQNPNNLSGVTSADNNRDWDMWLFGGNK